jgi:hypothetical protein
MPPAFKFDEFVNVIEGRLIEESDEHRPVRAAAEIIAGLQAIHAEVAAVRDELYDLRRDVELLRDEEVVERPRVSKRKSKGRARSPSR